ncbi:acetylserotonin O-methyltransferase-like isoform X1 [Zootoca vivipara]|uniref:acetylserotonin O-methyltransferase-like isoform X1 n=2 Tax=Zootoca vivipara TaxID=8524 RepID=UPI00293BB247|nr:acetylserotonin O-methyltransferase-like isoform X1 [Zootoca vivipara]XP_060129418.1 acetylserotonin O-methyltransferase-like isoform X1 [Zootoca vivipara]XP_060129419.1 acetylserotonin O-methyltransferase-like isoform X1 [Zootoca vivipara]XP_060129420.1 acetylserotonin O-methyltransferase-like isoform X1 [Zootoca vivipara]XP_060129421.1 acetylserotonin O-methyltransferase-like isoform X1 [Zootoca vivipara]
MNATEEAEALKMLFLYQHAYLIPKIMFTASDLGVFDLLMESKEPLTSMSIAERLGTSPFGMERLLDACVGLKFLQVERKDNQTLYGNTNLVNLYLGKRSPKTQYYSLKNHAEFNYTRAQHLTDAVREGEGRTYRLSDSSTKIFFEAFYRYRKIVLF